MRNGCSALRRPPPRVFLARLFCAGLFIPALASDKLEKFEKSLAEGRKNEANSAPKAVEKVAASGNGDTLALRARSDATDSSSESFWSAIFIPVFYGGMESLAAVAPDHWGLLQGIEVKREPGSTLIPFSRVDFSWQSIDNNLDAYDLRGEIGFGPLGVQARRTWYDETGGVTGEMQLTQVHFLYRMQFLERVEVDFGAGPTVLDGKERYHAGSFTLPIQIRFNDWLTAEFRPMWVTFDDSEVQDYELCAHFTWHNFGLKAGYRWLTNEEESLEAPLIGFSARW